MQHGPGFTFTVRRRKDSPFWQARIFVEGEEGQDLPGRRFSTGIEVGAKWRQSQRAAEAVARERAEHLVAARKEIDAAESDTALEVVAARMLRHKAAGKSRDRNIDALAFNLDKHVKPYFGARRDVTSIRRLDLEKFKLKLVDDRRAPTSINNALTAIRQTLKYACFVEELIDHVPAVENVPVPKGHKGMPVSPEKFDEYINSFSPHELEEREFNVYLANTGHRKTEALELRWEWVDWDKRCIRVPGKYRKGGQEQRAPTPTNDVLLALLKTRRSRARQPSLGRVWFQLDTYDEARHRAAEKAGIKGFRHHDCRHTRATQLGANGATEFDLRDAMGWSTTAMAGLYTHPDRERMHAMAAEVSFGSVPGGVPGKKAPRGQERRGTERARKPSKALKQGTTGG